MACVVPSFRWFPFSCCLASILTRPLLQVLMAKKNPFKDTFFAQQVEQSDSKGQKLLSFLRSNLLEPAPEGEQPVPLVILGNTKVGKSTIVSGLLRESGVSKLKVDFVFSSLPILVCQS